MFECTLFYSQLIIYHRCVVQSQQVQVLSLNHLLHMLHDIASGMKYLTDKGYVHTVNVTTLGFSVLHLFCSQICTIIIFVYS